MTSTHDLPTVAGWWSGADIATRAKLGLADEAREPKERAQDRKALWSAFRTGGVARAIEPPPSQPDAAVDAAIAFTAQSPAPLALIPIEDVLGLTEQPNLPGTIDEHPNWRRRLEKPSAELFDRAAGARAPQNLAGALMAPRATYRLQFHKGFTFADAERLVPYFARLGISHVYASPITTARAGSMHGYDVIDPTRVNPELGGEEALRKLVAALRAAGLGLIVDIVPNHMAVGAENAWWFDVLRHGPQSRYAPYFDIDWNAEDEGLRGKVLLPVLGKPLREVIEASELKVEGDELRYFEHRFPLRPDEDASASAP